MIFNHVPARPLTFLPTFVPNTKIKKSTLVGL
jgi:hypothetical protein